MPEIKKPYKRKRRRRTTFKTATAETSYKRRRTRRSTSPRQPRPPIKEVRRPMPTYPQRLGPGPELGGLEVRPKAKAKPRKRRVSAETKGKPHITIKPRPQRRKRRVIHPAKRRQVRRRVARRRG